MSATIENQAALDVPTEPKPTFSDVPWWSLLITAFVVSIVSIIATVMAQRSGVSVSGGLGGASVAGLAVDTLMYMPHILLLFGVLADMFTYDGVWSIPSLIGVLSIFVNFVFQYFWIGLDELWNTTSDFLKGHKPGLKAMGTPGVSGGTPVVPEVNPFKGGGLFGEKYDGCSVQGFEAIATRYAPQTLVVTATVFSYYCFDIVRNRGWVNSIAALSFFAMTYIGQVAILATTGDNGCKVGGDIGGGAVLQGARALVEGVFFGGTSYGIVQTYYPSRLPSSTVSPFPRRTAADLTPGPDGTLRDSDGFPYVVLPNGQAVPDMSKAESRKAFAETASKVLGTGTPATACNLAANAPVDERLAQISALASAASKS